LDYYYYYYVAAAVIVVPAAAAAVSCHRPFLPDTSFEPAVIPTTQASSFTLL
jgi:hypothetical protein